MSRAFVPAFFTAFCLRFGDSLPFLKQIPLFQGAGVAPSWFTNSWVIGLLGILALVEIGATKLPEFTEFMDGVHKYGRVGMTAVSTFGILPAGDARFIEQTLNLSQTAVIDAVVSAIAATAVWFSATLRNSIMSLLNEIDPEDDLNIQSFISWVEDGWSFIAVFLFFIYPLFVVVLIFIIIGLFLILRAYLRHREEKAKVFCAACGQRIFSSALNCPSCKSLVNDPKNIGIFGTAIASPITDRHLHALRLTEKRRCPLCATRLKKRSVRQICDMCGTSVFATNQIQQEYLRLIQNRLIKTIVVVGGLGIIPVIGTVPSILYYRFNLVTPFKSYIPAGQGLLLKIFIKIICFLLIGLQAIPIIGTVSLPIMAILNYKIYRKYFIKQF